MEEKQAGTQIVVNSNGAYGLSGDVQQRLFRNPAAVYLLSLGSKFSRAGMKYALMQFAKFYGYTSLDAVPWQKLDVGSINLFKTQLEQKGRSPNTINTYLRALRGVINAAWQIEQISDHQKNLLMTVKPVRGSRKPKGRALSPVESSRLIESCHAERDNGGVRDVAILSLGIGCGLRRNELAGLTLSGVDMESQSIRVIGKGNKEREVPASEIVFVRLKRWLELRGEGGCDKVFCCLDKHGNIRVDKAMNPFAVFAMIKKRGKAAGLENFTPHDLRRTFATRMLDIGADISIVKEAMGHASIVTTQRYDKRGLEKIREFTRAITV